MSEPHGKRWEMEKRETVKMFILPRNCRNTTILSDCNLTNASIEYLFRCCYFSHYAKSTLLLVYNVRLKEYKIKVIVEAEAKQLGNHSRFMDFVSPWCNAGKETRQLFFLASLRCLQNMQILAVSLLSILN